MIIAGLTGGIGHGKTTFADLLAGQSGHARHVESSELIAEIATSLRSEQLNHPAPDDISAINTWLAPLAEIVRLQVHASIDPADLTLTTKRLAEHPEYFDKLFEYLRQVQTQPSLASVEITNETKEAFRPLLQWLGGYLVIMVGPGVWYDEIIRRIGHLRQVDLVTIGGVRYPGDAERIRNAGGYIVAIERPGQATQDATDLTERQRSLITPDATVINDASLAALATCAQQVHTDLGLRQLQKRYLASDYR